MSDLPKNNCVIMNSEHMKGFFYLMAHNDKNTSKLTPSQSKALKHQLLNNGTYYRYKQTRHDLNRLKPKYKTFYYDEITGEYFEALNDDYYKLSEQTYKKLILDISSLGLEQCEKIDRNKYMRTTRLRKRISTMINSNNSYFITLTFTDETLANTSEDTRRQLVRRFLKAQCTEYVANIDYGKTTEREHYHAITNANIEGWSYGFYNVKPIRPNLESEKRIPVYITKLTHHALKQSAKGSNLIYSR